MATLRLRAGAGTQGQRFVADDNEVCDNNTGLYWVKEPDPTKRTFIDALTYCTALDLGNSPTYRLPEVGELSSLVDYSQRNPALPPGHPFMNPLTAATWTATPVIGKAVGVWLVVVGSGTVIEIDSNLGHDHDVWCVRSGS